MVKVSPKSPGIARFWAVATSSPLVKVVCLTDWSPCSTSQWSLLYSVWSLECWTVQPQTSLSRLQLDMSAFVPCRPGHVSSSVHLFFYVSTWHRQWRKEEKDFLYSGPVHPQKPGLFYPNIQWWRAPCISLIFYHANQSELTKWIAWYTFKIMSFLSWQFSSHDP